MWITQNPQKYFCKIPNHPCKSTYNKHRFSLCRIEKVLTYSLCRYILNVGKGWSPLQNDKKIFMKNNYLLKFEDKSLGFPTFREVRAYTEEEAIKIAGEDLGSDYHLVKIYIEVKNIL